MSNEIGRRELIQGAVLGVGAVALAAASDSAQAASAGAIQKTQADIINLAKALEAAEMAKNVDEYLSYLAEDYTEINGRFAHVMKGRDTARKHAEFWKTVPHQIAGTFMSNPKVQVWSDEFAVLCYVSLRSIRDGEGRSDPGCRRVTRAYSKRDGQWKVVHTHFSSYDYVSTY